MPAVWLHTVLRSASPCVDAVARAVRAAGLEVAERPPRPDLPGIVVFDDPERAAAFLRAECHALQRVLAIAPSSASVRGEAAWLLLGAGASDVLAWDRADEPAAVIPARLARWHAVDEIVDSPLVRENLIGRSPGWLTVIRQIVEVAVFTDASVLVLGESGTGKELVARLVHTLDPRPRKRELVVLDCTTIVPELSGSEFFGHERGAFTGAAGEREGAFALADGGTLFLDEVGELAAALQSQLLRVVQERTFKRVGGNSWQRTCFRLVCATNRDLEGDVAAGRFRRDLFHRITSWVVRLPPLDQRRDDILALAAHFLRQTLPAPAPALDPSVEAYLLARPYPGNVRDLRQLVQRIGQRHVGPGPITIGDIPTEERLVPERAVGWRNGHLESAIREALATGAGLKEIGRSAADVAVRVAVDQEHGNLQRAARRLGVTDRALQLRRAPRRNGADHDAAG